MELASPKKNNEIKIQQPNWIGTEVQTHSLERKIWKFGDLNEILLKC